MPVQRSTPCPPPHLAPWQSGVKSFYRLREGATCRNSTVGSNSLLETGHQRSHQRHLDCFKCSLSLVAGSVCFHFFEASSGNCGSSCHGYSLFIMYLTSSTWWEFQHLQDSLQDIAQYIITSSWEGTKSPWLCLWTELLLFGFFW